MDTKSNHIKLTTEEINEIASLSEEYKSSVFKCGELHLQMAEVKFLLEEMQQKDKTLMSHIEKLKDKEKDLINNILTKYGEGSISLKDGVFIPDNSK
jgi:hypothetical protein